MIKQLLALLFRRAAQKTTCKKFLVSPLIKDKGKLIIHRLPK